MAGIAEASPYIACGPDYANAGHISLPYPPAEREGTSTTIWPNLCYSSTGLEHSDVFLPALPLQTTEWDIAEGFLKYPDPSITSPPAESVTSGSEGSQGAGMIWDYQNDQLPQGPEYSPSTPATSTTSDNCFSIAPSSLHTFKEPSPSASKKQTKTRKASSSSTEEGSVAKRPRRTKTPQEQEASRQRIREKNRVAADKCRGRQRVAVEKLSSRHDALEEENRQLSQIMKDLVAERIVLKNMLLEHGGCGCELIENYLRDSAVRWVKQVESQSINVDAA
ncbi:transcriptional regulator family: bZIP [Trichoderma aggressivum f. europaeum]|uniref:Transcriptional regulator family: bZIP n=1 Tax=Trichoderma aggressivum f. europaeum TaxID=173218 RepID=A0AAE1M3N7_9HYPO|nr:transcriptional regulator family: bZIP [Trichoderma aggressivum f. europaeum]